MVTFFIRLLPGWPGDHPAPPPPHKIIPSPPPSPATVLLPIPVPTPFGRAVSSAGQNDDAAGQSQETTAQISSFCFIATSFFAVSKTLVLYPEYPPPRNVDQCGEQEVPGIRCRGHPERVSASSCPRGRPSNLMLASVVLSHSFLHPRTLFTLYTSCVCPNSVTVTRLGGPFLLQEWEHSQSLAGFPPNTRYQS